MALPLDARRTDFIQAFIAFTLAHAQLAYAISLVRDRWPKENNQWSQSFDTPKFTLDHHTPDSVRSLALAAVHAHGFPNATQAEACPNPEEIPERQSSYDVITLGDPNADLAQKLRAAPLIDLIEQYIDAKMLFDRDRKAIIWIPLVLVNPDDLANRYKAVGWSAVEYYLSNDSIGSITLRK